MKFAVKLAVLATAGLALAGCSTFKGWGGAEAPVVNGQDQTQTSAIEDNSGFDSESLASGQESTGPGGMPNVIHFGFDKFSLSTKEQQVAQQNAQYLLQHPDVHVMIAGNTDPRGSQEYNFHLGERRAQAVQNYLQSQGVPASQLCTVSYGELRPAATPAQFGGNWHKAYALDRRSEIMYNQTCHGQELNG